MKSSTIVICALHLILQYLADNAAVAINIPSRPASPPPLFAQGNRPPALSPGGSIIQSVASHITGNTGLLPEWAPNGLSMAGVRTFNAYGQPGLRITDWLNHDEDTSTAAAHYMYGNALLKCSKNVDSIQRETEILKVSG